MSLAKQRQWLRWRRWEESQARIAADIMRIRALHRALAVGTGFYYINATDAHWTTREMN